VEEACLGFQHALVRTRGGRAFAWGKGERGQLGNGATANHPSAFPLDLPEGTPPVVKVGGCCGSRGVEGECGGVD
jgi:alpha-tubulin suppressor-like RCC1 family protein